MNNTEINSADLLNQLNQQQQNGSADQTTLLQSLLGGTDGGSLIPESLVQTLTISFIVLNVVGVLFLIAYILSVVRKWKVQSAVLHMRKDLEEIKAHMLPPAPQPEPVVTQTETPDKPTPDEQPNNTSTSV